MSEGRLVDGSFDWANGVDSSKTSTVQGPANPNGLPRTMLAWLNSGTVRDGCIGPRYGWTRLARVHDGSAYYQVGYLYEQLLGNPYLMLSIGGFIYQVRVDTDNSVHQITNSSSVDGRGQSLVNPSKQLHGYMVQGEQFLVIQAGDWQVNQAGTNPMWWDGNGMTRSYGLNSPGNPVELPPALSMVYYQDRIWYSNNNVYTAGDIVGGPSGTSAYKFTDSILRVTENPLAIGGDGFRIPSNAGTIIGMSYPAVIDTTLGQGDLYVFTRKKVYGLQVPISRNDWIAANNNNMPRQYVAVQRYGAVSDRSITPVNADLFYASPEPGIRSLAAATRYYDQPGNVAISQNIQRALNFTTPQLMNASTGINFDNRLLMGILPVQTPVGTAYQGLAALNFDLISTIQEKHPPSWEGIFEGFDVLQLFEGDFGGIPRAFAVVHNRSDHWIEVWELTTTARQDSGSSLSRVQWQFETPAFNFALERDLKELDGGELWIDRISGTVEMTVEFRTDADACWNPWVQVQFCAAATTCETVTNPICYPTQPFCEGQKFPLGLPKPKSPGCMEMNQRPATVGYQFQLRVTIKGFCRIRGIILYALPKKHEPFYNVKCQ